MLRRLHAVQGGGTVWTVPLLAVDTDRDDAVIDLTDVSDEVWVSIWRQATGDRLRCRSCSQPMHAKQSSATGLRFFAHTNVVPECPSQGESARHLHLKNAFARAFRTAGWVAQLEVAGEGWRADVLVTAPTGQQVAFEVQLSPITLDEVQERQRRHQASALHTVWVVSGKRPLWARSQPTVLVTDTDTVVDTVLIAGTTPDVPPVWAGPASINRFVQRWSEGRLSAISIDSGLEALRYRGAPTPEAFQLDHCVDVHLEQRQRQQAEEDAREALRQASRAPTNALMQDSLRAFVQWFAPWERRAGYHCWFRGSALRYPAAAAQSDWDHDVGIVILVGSKKPSHVLALAEPRARSTPADPRVCAWTVGRDPATVVTGFNVVLTPESDIQELPWLTARSLKPFRSKRRW